MPKTVFANIRLRARMMEKQFQGQDLARILKRSDSYFSSRITGRAPWDLDDVYALCDWLEIPPEEIHLYFPPRKESRHATHDKAV